MRFRFFEWYLGLQMNNFAEVARKAESFNWWIILKQPLVTPGKISDQTSSQTITPSSLRCLYAQRKSFVKSDSEWQESIWKTDPLVFLFNFAERFSYLMLQFFKYVVFNNLKFFRNSFFISGWPGKWSSAMAVNLCLFFCQENYLDIFWY